MQNLLNRFFTNFGGKVAHNKKRLDFGGNPDHVTSAVSAEVCPLLSAILVVKVSYF